MFCPYKGMVSSRGLSFARASMQRNYRSKPNSRVRESIFSSSEVEMNILSKVGASSDAKNHYSSSPRGNLARYVHQHWCPCSVVESLEFPKWVTRWWFGSRLWLTGASTLREGAARSLRNRTTRPLRSLATHTSEPFQLLSKEPTKTMNTLRSRIPLHGHKWN